MIKLKTLLSLLFIAVTAISCGLENKKSDKGWNLVLRDGLLYSDSLTIEPFTGHYKGKVMGKSIEYDVVDGKRNGIFILYNENGYVETFGYLKDNKNHGEWKYYYPNGELESVGIFYDDKPDSLWNWFYMNGKILQEGWFNEGKKDGEWKFYDEFENLTLFLKYNNDILIDSVNFKVKLDDRIIGLDTLSLNTE